MTPVSTREYVGSAALVAKVITVTPGGTIAATDTFTVTIGNVSFTFPATTTTVAHVVTGLYNLIVASQAIGGSQGWAGITPTDSVTTLTLTQTNPGEDFTVSAAINNVSGGAAPTLTVATTTANSGPSQYDLAANWSGNAIPANGDTVIIERTYQLLYGDLSAVTAARLIVRDFSGQIGLPPINAIGGYPEYRSQYLLLSATLLDQLQNVSGATAYNVGSVQTLANIYSGAGNQDTFAGTRLLGTHASNVLNALGGSVGVATEAGEAATLTTFTVGSGATLELGLGCTLAAGTQDGGTLIDYASMSGALVINGGTATLIDKPTITGATSVYQDGTLIVNGNCTFTAAVTLFGGTMDLSQDTRLATVTGGVTVYPGSTLNDPFKRLGTCTITMAGGADTDGPQTATVRLGPNRVHAVS